jgi:hypothetical protein
MIELLRKKAISRIIIEIPPPSSPIVQKNSPNKQADHELHHSSLLRNIVTPALPLLHHYYVELHLPDNKPLPSHKK